MSKLKILPLSLGNKKSDERQDREHMFNAKCHEIPARGKGSEESALGTS